MGFAPDGWRTLSDYLTKQGATLEELIEAGLLVMLLPPIAWYLGISLKQAFLMDMTFVGFYVVYAFAFNLAYDRIFPVQARPVVGVA